MDNGALEPSFTVSFTTHLSVYIQPCIYEACLTLFLRIVTVNRTSKKSLYLKCNVRIYYSKNGSTSDFGFVGKESLSFGFERHLG